MQVQDPFGTPARATHVWGVFAYDYPVIRAVVTHETVSPEGLTTALFLDQKGREIAKTLSGSGYPERRAWTAITEPSGGTRTENAYGPAPGNLNTTSYSGAGKPVLITDNSGGRTEKSCEDWGQVSNIELPTIIW